MCCPRLPRQLSRGRTPSWAESNTYGTSQHDRISGNKNGAQGLRDQQRD